MKANNSSYTFCMNVNYNGSFQYGYSILALDTINLIFEEFMAMTFAYSFLSQNIALGFSLKSYWNIKFSLSFYRIEPNVVVLDSLHSFVFARKIPFTRYNRLSNRVVQPA